MPFNVSAAWKAAQTIFGLAEVGRQAFGARSAPGTALEPRGGLLGEVEARLTGVMISALKEAFDRDAARLEAERAALEESRRRAEEALRLELVRQAGERALARLRTAGGLALVIWIVSVLFAMRLPEGFAGAGRAMLGAGWASLAASMACAFVAQQQVSAFLASSQAARAGAGDLPDGTASRVAPWLALTGLVLVGLSLLLAL